MKFLAGLVQAAVASQIVFDSHDPVDEGAEGTTISRDYGAAMQFRTPAAANDACDPEGLTVELVTFTMHTVEVPRNSWLQVAICPSANGLPDCTTSNHTTRISIDELDYQVKVRWPPTSPIVLDRSKLYWFTVGSNVADRNKSPTWLFGNQEFNIVNDPNRDVVLAYKPTHDGPWYPHNQGDNRNVYSLQVYAN